MALTGQDQVKIWRDDDDYCDDEIVKWYDGYKKCKVHKAKLKDLFSAGWHTSRSWDWCIPEDYKKETEKLWSDK